MVTVDQLLILANAYATATNHGLRLVSVLACGNNKTLLRLQSGLGANTDTLAKAARWFDANWPAEVPWPNAVPRPEFSEATPGL
jgi:hypothetical protein